MTIGKSRGLAHYGSHTCSPSIHAEFECLLNVNFLRGVPEKKRKQYWMIVIKTDKKGEVRMSRPCSHCIRLLKKCHIPRVFYSDNDGNFIEEFVNEMDEATAHMTTGWRCIQLERAKECIS